MKLRRPTREVSYLVRSGSNVLSNSNRESASPLSIIIAGFGIGILIREAVKKYNARNGTGFVGRADRWCQGSHYAKWMKASALDYGMLFARIEIVITTDSDSIVEIEAIGKTYVSRKVRA